MSIISNPIGSIIEGVGSVIDDLTTSDEERLAASLRARELDLRADEIQQRTDLAQIDANRAQAEHPSRFVAGARPAIIWVGAASLAWTYVMHPVMTWAWALAQAKGWLAPDVPPPPTLDTDTLMVVVGGVLGLSGMRSFDKAKRTDTRRIG